MAAYFPLIYKYLLDRASTSTNAWLTRTPFLPGMQAPHDNVDVRMRRPSSQTGPPVLLAAVPLNIASPASIITGTSPLLSTHRVVQIATSARTGRLTQHTAHIAVPEAPTTDDRADTADADLFDNEYYEALPPVDQDNIDGESRSSVHGQDTVVQIHEGDARKTRQGVPRIRVSASLLSFGHRSDCSCSLG
jgi:hypothetical protein